MKSIGENHIKFDYNNLSEHKEWNESSGNEALMHRIHSYPAKFPSFIVNKSIAYAKNKGIRINMIGDIFCGCGTTALEAKRSKIDFWGCDINPIATLITKVKTSSYKLDTLDKIFSSIIDNIENDQVSPEKILLSDERIQYWFEKEKIIELSKIKKSIIKNTSNGKYRDFFFVAFSNILKGSSRWLTKSIKPTIDRNKKSQKPLLLFIRQYRIMRKALNEENDSNNCKTAKTDIKTSNILTINPKKSFLDLIITSPPYVTSYEYADIHQLSTLWLTKERDYKSLRNGTIGSIYNQNHNIDKLIEKINIVGKGIVNDLISARNKRYKAVAKYFHDISIAVSKTHELLKKNGLAVFVIGNSKFGSITIDNAKYLAQCLLDKNFKEINVFKRKISSKILTPFRDKDGKFSNDKRKRKIYNYEFILIAKK
ncbi:MAG: hypothetical protein K2Y12_08550 [Chitinophagaceae bacterium]|nr:hypothetical protein [Chitinophagaceae bacterium]